jgi:hypothetical protein
MEEREDVKRKNSGTYCTLSYYNKFLFFLVCICKQAFSLLHDVANVSLLRQLMNKDDWQYYDPCNMFPLAKVGK